MLLQAQAKVDNTTVVQYSRAIPLTVMEAKPAATAEIGGLEFAAYEGQWEKIPDFAALVPVKAGVAPNFDPSVRSRETLIGLRFTGYLRVPRNGAYTFTITSDDGAKLFIGTKLVVDNDGLHAPQEATGKIDLKAGTQPIQLAYIQGDGGLALEVMWEGPGVARQKIPDAALLRVKSEQ